MKYIRTKDGKIWSFSNPNNEFLYEGSDKKNGKWLCEIGAVFKEADTIEELCDEFVGISNGEPQMLRFIPYACAQCWNDGIYGAVWTDEGLIYVAKMSGERKFELL